MFRYALQDLKNWSLTANPKPLVIRGARQVGKSTLVRLFCKDNGLELIEINLEKNKIREFDNDVSFSIKKVLSEIELIVDKVISSNTLIFLDEIQDQPKAFAQLRYFYEDAPGLRVVAAGSLLDVIINEAKFSMPVGRIEYYFLGPMTYREFLLAQNEEVALKQLESITHDVPVSVALHEKMIEQLKNYYFVGGMPEAVKVFVETKDRAKVRRVQQDLLQTYRDDIPKYTIGKQGLRVREVFDYVPAHVGNNKVKFTDISETNSQQVKDAIELLHRAQIILKVSHTSASGLPLSAGVNPSVMKLFFLDVGLYNASMGVQWSSLVHASEEELLLKGSMAEQFIAQHLNLLFPYVRNELYYWLRDGKAGGAEVDFVMALEGKIIPIEVKSGVAGKMRSVWQFLAEKKINSAVKFDLKARDKFLIEKSQLVPTSQEAIEVRARIQALPLYLVEFLLKFFPF